MLDRRDKRVSDYWFFSPFPNDESIFLQQLAGDTIHVLLVLTSSDTYQYRLQYNFMLTLLRETSDITIQ